MPSLRVSFTEMKGFAISSMLNSERMGPGDEEARQTAGPLLVVDVVIGSIGAAAAAAAAVGTAVC